MDGEDSERSLLGRIASAMSAAGITQNELARRLGTSASTVNGWFETEGARRKVPGGRHLMRLPEILGVNGHWLLTGQGDPNPPDPSTAELAFEGIRRIVQLADVAPDQLDRVLGSLVDWDRIKRGGGGPP